MKFFDTETIGLHGLAVLIQWADGDGPVHLHEVWNEPVWKTAQLIDSIASDEVVGFNLAFDWFHLCKWRTIIDLIGDKTLRPIDCIDLIWEIEPLARDGKCLKPKAACDLMVLASQGKHQSIMLEHNQIRIRSIPKYMAQEVAEELNDFFDFPDIYFERKYDPTERFHPVPHKTRKNMDDIVLSFGPSKSLKPLIKHFTGEDTINFDDICPPVLDEQHGFAPFRNWMKSLQSHVEHWATNERARLYATKDVEYTRTLWKCFGSPRPGDTDSNLTCMVGAVRWHGFSVRMDRVLEYRSQIQEAAEAAPKDPGRATAYLRESMDPEDWAILGLTGTKKQVLMDLIETYEGTEVAERAKKILKARQSKYDLDMCDKLIAAGRFHAAAQVIGTLSGRKSGAGGDFNSQGISKKRVVRELYDMAWGDYILCGGDFDSFEVVLADAFFDDPVLREDLQSGRSIHGIFGTFMYPGKTYDDIMASKGTANDLYKLSKSGVFLTLYGGTPDTYKRRLNVSIETATKAYQRFCERYQVVGQKRQEIFDQFTVLHQPAGRGTEVFCRAPGRTSISSMLGFERDFTPEIEIIRALHEFSGEVHAKFGKYDSLYPPIVRNNRTQKPSGALMSSIFAAAFGIQGGIQRAANNHVIQSTGSGICKELEHSIWAIQPHGFHDWRVAPLNMHDEVLSVTHPNYVDEVAAAVNTKIESYRDRVPLISMGWKTGMGSWGD